MLTEMVTTYFKSRPNLNRPHNKIAVLFLACSGSGKSTITQKIVDNLGATYLRNDDARLLLQEYAIDTSPKDIINATWEKMRAESKNQFIVFDSNMSSYYMHNDSYYHVALREGYRVFIITIDLPVDELEARVKNRKRHDSREVLKLLPAQFKAQEEAMAVLNSNFTVTLETDYRELIDALRQFETEG